MLDWFAGIITQRQHNIIDSQIKLKQAVGTEICIVRRNGTCKLVVAHVEMTKRHHLKIWEGSVQLIMALKGRKKVRISVISKKN
jgi:hypothetical protein